MSETPETDVFMRAPGPFRNGATREELRLADFARRLERERDAAREALREALKVLADIDDEGLIEHSESMIRWRDIAGAKS